MLSALTSIFFGDKAARTYKRHKATIQRINEWFEEFEPLSDEQLRAKTQEFRGRLAEGETLDDILPEAFAVGKQACKRLKGQSWEAAGNTVTWDMVPFDVQLAGGIELHNGNIAEMATGEGKTLVAVLPLYLNAIEGKGSHLITVNDYLAKRDSQWMGKVFEFLGLTVGCILTDMEPDERRVSYSCDITYGTNNEFGFDYLRDNMAHTVGHLVQRGHHYAIVDEVDSVLIDEARTPLIISGAVDRNIDQFDQLKPIVAELVRKQSLLVNKIVAEAEELLRKAEQEEKGSDELTYQAGIKLLQARKGHPKHPRLTKVMGEAKMQRLVERVENDFMRDKRMPELEEELYFVVDEKGHTIDTTLKGREALSPSDPDLYLVPDVVEMLSEIETRGELNREEKDKLRETAMAEQERKTEIIHSLNQLLRAYTLYEKDVEYVIQDNKVIIVDEFTGRLMPGRRWSDGLHQAVEAKEGVKVEKETQTLATITLQNYFRMYKKLAGMTGTAETEASEFAHTYKMDVAVIPTNKPIRRYDDNDLIYKTQREKYNAIIEHVTKVHESGMPMLIGTVSVEVSEKLSRLLKRAGISHNVLNAKQHAREAEIVREAGKIGAVTIATNMAGRGTDIKLGPGVIRCKSEGFGGECCPICPFKDEAGRAVNDDLTPCGLHIVGTERHEARRIDRQLRGRSGRQGDPGYSVFFVSLEDDLMRLFASERMANLMAKGFEEGEAMSHGIATRAITSAQKKIEDINFERRKKTLDYDNVMNKQREAIYGFRRSILTGEGSMIETVMDVANEAITSEWEVFTEGVQDLSHADLTGYLEWIRRNVPLMDLEGVHLPVVVDEADSFLDEIERRVRAAYERKVKLLGESLAGALSRYVLLEFIDNHWRDNLLAIDVLREGIYLRSYGQLDPLTEYQKEATLLFQEMMYNIHKECFEHVFRATIIQAPQEHTSHVSFVKAEAAPATQVPPPPVEGSPRADDGEGNGAEPPPPPKVQTYRRDTAKVGRNDPCPCGSGKKYKNCHGAPKSGGRETA
ncbi:preprotein translocase subunit SecA [Candidatus Sumerlaeota bacterium]|nr:preprotein translocase subunit SecA [Candidatus Sumerlaeota bacterium]